MEDDEDFYGSEVAAPGHAFQVQHSAEKQNTAMDTAQHITSPNTTTGDTSMTPAVASDLNAAVSSGMVPDAAKLPDIHQSIPGGTDAASTTTLNSQEVTPSTFIQSLAKPTTGSNAPHVVESSHAEYVPGQSESTSHHETADEAQPSAKLIISQPGADQNATVVSNGQEEAAPRMEPAPQPATEHVNIDEAESALAANGGGDHEMKDAGKTEPEGPEFEADESPYESSSDDSSDSSSDDSDDDYKLMDPREAARLLMEDGGSDDEGGKKGGGGGILRTQNEQIDEIVEMPDIEVTEDMKIEELGNISVILDNVALVKAKASGELKVLESSSLLCRADRMVIGVIAETIGRVEEPMYVVRFTNPAKLTEFELEVGSTIYFVPVHSRVVLTKALQVKGSDASNLHDEEVGENEIEFSDDEAEQAHKASIKRARQAKREGKTLGPADNYQRQSNDRPSFAGSQPRSIGVVPMELSYDDGGPGEDAYTPLARPSNLADLMRQVAPGEEKSQAGRFMGANRGGEGSYRGRGRGDRGGRDRGGNRGRARGRGDFAGRGRGRDMDRQDGSPQQYQPQHQQSNAYPGQWNPATSGWQPGAYAGAPSAPAFGQAAAAAYSPTGPQFQVAAPGQFPPFNPAAFQAPSNLPGVQPGYAAPQWPQQQQYSQGYQPNTSVAGQQNQQQQNGMFNIPGFYGVPPPGNPPNGAPPGQYQNQPGRQ